MLISFTVGNYRSFYKRKTLSLIAQKLSEDAKDNVAKQGTLDVLKTLALYGANSSGKSNLVRALLTMGDCVLGSVRLNEGDQLQYDPFLLVKNKREPTFFEVSFVKDATCFRYGFTYSLKRIEEEWLFSKKPTARSKEQVLFIRNADGIGVDAKAFPEGEGNEEKTNDNRLFLSLCGQMNGDVSNQVISWFHSGINVVSGISNQRYRDYSARAFLENSEESNKAKDFFKQLQLGFEDLSARQISTTLGFTEGDSPIVHKRIVMDTFHNVYNDAGSVCGTATLSLDKNESDGTNKLFDLSGPIFNSLMNGSVLVVDELDAKMHPLISQFIIRLFNNPETNPQNAQLIFTTHDTHLLSAKILRRDQIWFTEKNDREQTDLYCLVDIVLPDGSKPRNDANYEKNYIAGRYGAIPFMVND